MGNALKPLGNRDDFPESDLPPSFDHNIGFPKGRKERAWAATEQEMIAGNVPKQFRDYCAHKYMDIRACERVHFPFYRNCKHQYHAYADCLGHDFSLRVREFERERRLLRRQKKKEQA